MASANKLQMASFAAPCYLLYSYVHALGIYSRSCDRIFSVLHGKCLARSGVLVLWVLAKNSTNKLIKRWYYMHADHQWPRSANRLGRKSDNLELRRELAEKRRCRDDEQHQPEDQYQQLRAAVKDTTYTTRLNSNDGRELNSRHQGWHGHHCFRKGVKDESFIAKFTYKQLTSMKDLFYVVNSYATSAYAVFASRSDWHDNKSQQSSKKKGEVEGAPQALGQQELRLGQLEELVATADRILNILFAKTLDNMKIPRLFTAFLAQIALPVTFGAKDSYWTESICFKVVNYETTYHVFIGMPVLGKFKEAPHCYLMVKMSGPHGVIALSNDIKQAFAWDAHTCEIEQSIEAKIDQEQIHEKSTL
uniref:Uncharacterized protein n=1 Tax=Oryza brachyantha TaxID=4533 RepID=J3L046_ORYBR